MIRRIKIRAWPHHAAGRVIPSAALWAPPALARPTAPVAAQALACSRQRHHHRRPVAAVPRRDRCAHGQPNQQWTLE